MTVKKKYLPKPKLKLKIFPCTQTQNKKQKYHIFYYVCTQTSEATVLSSDRRAWRDFKLAGQDMLCKFWTFLHFFLSIILI